MHDVLEGVVPFVLKACLRQWMKENRPNFNADILNRRILRFRFSSYDKARKPTARFTDDMLKEEKNHRQLECLHFWVKLCGNERITEFTEKVGALAIPEGLCELAIDWNCYVVTEPDYPPQPSNDHQLNHVFMLSAAERWTSLYVLILKCG